MVWGSNILMLNHEQNQQDEPVCETQYRVLQSKNYRLMWFPFHSSLKPCHPAVLPVFLGHFLSLLSEFSSFCVDF